MNDLTFVKMHGIGNDFVVLDARRRPIALPPALIKAIADRHSGVGFDQLLLIEPPRRDGAAFLSIFNPDGSRAGACGNGTRCIARLLIDEGAGDPLLIETDAGTLTARQRAGEIEVEMGAPCFAADQIPLCGAFDPRGFDLPDYAHLGKAVALSMGNPHVVFFPQPATADDFMRLGPQIEHHPAFPQRVNVGFAEIHAADHIGLRVWERGAGPTLACGSGACAALVAGVTRGLTARRARVDLPGGSLRIEWRDDGMVTMTGPTALVYCGTLSGDLLAAA